MPFGKKHIVKSVQKETDSTKNRQLAVVENLIEAIDSTTCLGEDICHLSLGGRVLKKRRNAKKDLNAGQDPILAQGEVAMFKCSGKLRDRINE